MSWREHFTLLHLPTTSVLLSLAVLGSLIAQDIYLHRLLLFLTQVFLGGSVSANYFDEIVDRPWRTRIPQSQLWIVAATSLSAFIAIGLYLTISVAYSFVIFVIAESFIIVAYDLELFGGVFHNSETIGVSWALVFLAGYYLQDQTLSPLMLIVSLLVCLCSMQGIDLYEKGKSFGKDRNHADPEAKFSWKVLRAGIVSVNVSTVVLVVVRLLFL
jgi:4-hydroxybenzoate polyprenyltransferase